MKIPEVTIYGPYGFNNLEPLKIPNDKLVQHEWTRYNETKYTKKQIVLHHTVSGDGITGDLRHWQNWRSVSTPIVIARDGTINQLFSSRYWAHHLGVRGNKSLDKHSIGVELDNWGPLVLGDGTAKQFGERSDGSPNIINTESGKYYAVYGNVVNNPVTFYSNNFRGYKVYEQYTVPQLKSLGELLLLWNKTYDIPLTYNEDMWDVSQRALSGEPGVWSHTSYRKPSEKQDCHPQTELIHMLKSVEQLV